MNMSSAIYPDPPRLVIAVCGHGEQQRLSNARLRLTFLLFPGYSLARARREIPNQSSWFHRSIASNVRYTALAPDRFKGNRKQHFAERLNLPAPSLSGPVTSG